MKLSRDVVLDLMVNRTDEELGLTVEANEYVGERRWVSEHFLVLRDNKNGKLWATTYERGLTEMQDIGPFEDLETINFEEVAKVPVTTYEYRRVTANESPDS